MQRMKFSSSASERYSPIETMKSITVVSAGLFAAWAVHDTEELGTMAAGSRRVFGRVPRALPLPESLQSRGLSQPHVNLSVGLMAIPVAAAAIRGVRTQGRSRWFRGALLAFGIHGFTHLGNSAVMRSYTTGAATAPVIVIPYWLLARSVLRRHGLDTVDRTTTAAAIAVFPLTIGVHLVSAAILGERSLGRSEAPERTLETAGQRRIRA